MPVVVMTTRGADGAAATLAQRSVAEGVGTAFLLATIVGSGIMAERLAGDNTALALLANTIATGAALAALILAFGAISGAHFNPAVTLAEASRGALVWSQVPAYIGVQTIGAVVGVWVAHGMFEVPIFMVSSHARNGPAQMFSEFVATFGLLAVIRGCSHRRPDAVPFAVAAHITAAYWFTASTSFANPAVTLARSLTDSFAGIRPVDVPGFVLAQLAGATSAAWLCRWLVPPPARVEREIAGPSREIHAMRTVLFACVHNAGRSQMAAAWFNRLADPEKARAISAGTDPGTHVHPEVVAAMREVGIDLSTAPTTKLTAEVAQQAQVLITMGCGDQCPVVPRATRDDWPLDDPKGRPIADVRVIRDEIRQRVRALIDREEWAGGEGA